VSGIAVEIAFPNKALDSICTKKTNPIISIKKLEKLYPQGVLNEFAHLELKYN